MEYTIRRANQSDLEALCNISIITFTDTYGEYNTPENLRDYLETHFNQQALHYQLENPEVRFFMVYDGTTPIAYLKLNEGLSQTESKYPNGLEIERIYVLPSYKGKGIGKMLVHHALHQAKSYDKENLWLGVWEKNEKAILFYEKVGFYKAGNHTFLLGDEEQNDFIMNMET